MSDKATGYIYIMTNPSFPEYVKIGYATDVVQRRDDLNSSSAVPFAFRIYATYEVDSALSDKKLHSILEAIAEINNFKHRLKKWKATTEEQQDEAIAQEISQAHQERQSPFTFSMCDIKPGEQIEFFCNGNEYTGTMCTVVDDKHIKYDGKEWSLSSLATKFTGSKWGVAGPRYFKYKGEWLNDIRERLGV